MSEKEEVKTVIEVGGKEFDVVTKGREQASQILSFAKWIKNYGVSSLTGLSNEEGELEVENGYMFFAEFIDSLDVDALIDLYTIVLGCSKKFADEHFDIATLVDALVMIYESQPSFRRLLNRFFSTNTSETTTEEPSTKSE